MEKQYLAAAASVNQEVESDNPLPSPAQSSLVEAFEQPVSLDSEKKELDEVQGAEIDAKDIQLAELSTSDLLPQNDSVMTDVAGSLQNVGFEAADRNYQSGGYSSNGYGSSAYGASSGLSGPATVGLGLVGLVAVGAALSGDSSSSGGGSAVANTAPTITGPNQLSTNEDTSTTFSVSAFDADGDPLSYSVTTQNNGTVTPVTNNPGQFTYTPNANFNGTDTFTISVSDGNGGVTSKVFSVTVVPENGNVGNNVPPSVSANQSVDAIEDEPVTVTVQASDADGDSLTYSIASGPSNGSVAATGQPGVYIYTPDENYNGTDSFVVSVSDGKSASTQQVSLVIEAVNDAPTVDEVQNIPDATGGATNIKVDATDVDGDPLTYTVTSGPSEGTVVNNGEGNFVYTPTNSNYVGEDSFIVEVSDGNEVDGVSSQEVRLTINSNNDNPVLGSDQNLTTNHNASQIVTVSATDTNGDSLTYAASNPAHGVVVPTDVPGQFIYYPEPGFAGSDSFNVTASDGNGGVATQKVSIEVAAGVADRSLTNGTDTISGTAGADTYVGIVEADVAGAFPPFSSDTINSTLNAADTINGGSGVDRLSLDLSVNFTGLTSGSMQNVEILSIENTSPGPRVFNTVNMSGLKYLQLDANNTNFTFNNLADTDLVFELAAADSAVGLTYTLNYAANVNSGVNDSLTLFLNGAGNPNSVTVAAAGIENVTLVALSGDSVVDLSAFSELKMLTLAGESGIENSNATFTSGLHTVNGSAALGDLTLSLNSSAIMKSISTGLGDDDITAVGSSIRSSTVIDGGDGNDILRLFDVSSGTLTPNMKNVETLDLSLASAGQSSILSAENITGLRTVQISDAAGIDGDGTAVADLTIRQLGDQKLTLAFLEQDGEAYSGNDMFTVLDSGSLTISTRTENDDIAGEFSDKVTATSAPDVTLKVGANTSFSGEITANAANKVSIVAGTGGEIIAGAELVVNSATSLSVSGMSDSQIDGVLINGQNIKNIDVSGSVVINSLDAASNLKGVSEIVSIGRGGLDFGGAEIGAFSESVTVNSVNAIEATDSGYGLNVTIAARTPQNGSAVVNGSSKLDNNITIGAGRNDISVTAGLGDDTVALEHIFTSSDTKLVSINLGGGFDDMLTLAAGDNEFSNLVVAGVEFVKAGSVGDELIVNASAVSGQRLNFTDFAETSFLGTAGADTIDMLLLSVGGATMRISGGKGADTITGTAVSNTYVYNTGDVISGEKINFNTAAEEIISVESTTDFSLLNGGNSSLALLDVIEISEGQTAKFSSSQLSGLDTEINGISGGADEVLEIGGSVSGDVIDLSNATFTDAKLVINGLNGADTIKGSGSDDILVGGTGADTLSGGSGNDVFVHKLGDGVNFTSKQNLGASGLDNGDKITFANGIDKILDFKGGEDTVDLDFSGSLVDKLSDIDFAVLNLGITDNGFAFIQGNFGGDGGNVFTADGAGSDYLFAFDANATSAVQVEFIGLIDFSGSAPDATFIV